MKHFRLVIIASLLALIFLSLVGWILSKFATMNLKVSQKYEEVDYSADIASAETLGNVSLLFLLILSVLFLGVLVFSNYKR